MCHARARVNIDFFAGSLPFLLKKEKEKEKEKKAKKQNKKARMKRYWKRVKEYIEEEGKLCKISGHEKNHGFLPFGFTDSRDEREEMYNLLRIKKRKEEKSRRRTEKRGRKTKEILVTSKRVRERWIMD